MFGTLTIPLVYRCGVELLQKKVGLIAAFLIVINPYHIWYSQEGRMYALLGLIATASFLFFIRLLRQPTIFNLAGLIGVSAIGFTTHHFSFLLPFTQFIYLLITFRQNFEKLRWWALTQMIAGTSFIPWMWLVLRRQVFYATSGTTEFATLLDPLYTLWNFSIGYTGKIDIATLIICAIYGTLLIAGIWYGRRLLAIWFVLPIVVTLLASQRFPTYVDRYLIISFAPFLLLIASGLVKLPKIFQGIVLSIVMIISITGVGRIYFDDNIHQRTDWRGLAQYLKQNATPDDLILVQFFQDLIPLHFYSPGPAAQKPMITVDKIAFPTNDDGAVKQVWFVEAYYSPHHEHSLVGPCEYSTTTIDKFTVQIRRWQAKQVLVRTVDFNCVRLYLYEN